MATPHVRFWKPMPLTRLLLPFIAGITCQWYIGFTMVQLLFIFSGCLIIHLPFYWLPHQIGFSWRWLQGAALMLLLFAAGALVNYDHDLRNDPTWIGTVYKDSGTLLVTINEPLVEKAKSYKAVASVTAININGGWLPVKGKMLLYFRKDSLPPPLVYGSQLIFSKPLQAINNSGNPGAFDYQRYSAFHEIYHQCFFKKGEYVITQTTAGHWFRRWLYQLRISVVGSLKKYINSEREEGVAEALLIGYRDDLDKDLVQAYSNTGVVHIIAISGLHLGIIYGALIWCFSLFKKRRWIKWIKPVVVLCVLWIFSLVAGAAPSILRSAIMFTFLLLGETLDKKASIYNTLAASAFLILCWDSFSLWDVGFQLSYTAVASIVTFMQPVYNLFYIKNKLLDWVWKLNSVTLSAQVLTLPIVCFYFHQFPVLFLVTNLVVVPLAGLILWFEIGIVFFARFSYLLASFAGKISLAFLWLINSYIVLLNSLPFAVYGGIQVTALQTIVLYAALLNVCYWLLRKSKTALYVGLAFTTLFFTIRTVDFFNRSQQQKVIVYNISQHTAVDFISGRNFQFLGDTTILEDEFLQNFHLKPSRILNRVTPGFVDEAGAAYPFLLYKDKRILLVDKPFKFETTKRMAVEMIVLSKNPKIYIRDLYKAFDCKLYVFDASNPVWKINQWKKDCDSLHLRHYSTQEQGALELDL